MMKKWFYLMVLAIMPMFFVACSGDDDDDGAIDAIETSNIPMELLGTWNCDAGKRYLSFNFKADGTGSGAVWYEGSQRESVREYDFEYTVKDGTVTCKGFEIYSDSDGKVTTNKNWSTTFTFDGNVLKGGPYAGDSSSNTFYYGGGGTLEGGDEVPSQLIGVWQYTGPDAGADGYYDRNIEWVFKEDGTGTGYNTLVYLMYPYTKQTGYYSFSYVYNNGKLLLDAESWYGNEAHQFLRMDHLVFENGQLIDTMYGYVFTRK